MQNKKFSKILSIFSAAALLVTQLAVTLPASAENEEVASPFPGATEVYNVSFNAETGKDGNYALNSTQVGEADGGSIDVTIEAGVGVDGSDAMKVVMNNPTSVDRFSMIWPKNGSLYSMADSGTFAANTHYKYIVQLKYKVESGSSVIVGIGSGCANETAESCGSIGVKGKSFMTQENGDITKPGSWNLLYSPIYNEWTTISLPLDMVSESAREWQTFAMEFKQNAGKTATIYFDDIKLYKLDDQSAELGQVCFTTNGGKVLNPVAGVVGTDYTMPTLVKEGCEFVGWYTDEALTTPYDGKFPANSAKGGYGDSLVYTPLYAKWTFDPYVALYDDFESRDTLITEATAGLSIQDGKGKNGGKALVFDLANKSGTMNFVPQDAEGNRLAINAGESYRFIVTMTYKMTAGNNQYSPLYMKTQLVKANNGWLGLFAKDFLLGDVIWSSRVPYSTGLGYYCGPTGDGEWHTVSFPISGTGNSSTNGYLVHYFDNLGSNGEFIIDDIKYTRVDSSTELSTVKFNSKGDDYCDYMTVVTGTSTSELSIPTKEGYIFAGWYTDEACTVKCDAVPSNNQSQTENGNTTENVYVNLYAGWTAVSFDVNNDGSINIIDLISMKKSITNNESTYNSVYLAELRKVLLSGVKTEVSTDKNSYVLTVDEEFDGTALNTAFWNITGDKNDVTVENGLAVFGKNGTAGSIDSSYKFQYKYGYIEASVKLPETTGVTSAFWLNQIYAPTLRFSEIDIFETCGYQKVVSNIHKWDNNNKKDSYATTEEKLAFHTDWNANVLNATDKAAREQRLDASEFHTVGCEWGEDFVRFYLDGVMYFEVNAEKYPDDIEIIKASPLFIVLSVDSTAATLTGTSGDWMQVDYVRLYQNAAESTLIN